MTFNVAIIGPGRTKQGTGPFIARTFKELGCNVQAIVSSSIDSATKTAAHFKTEYEIDCHAYDCLETLLAKHSIDVAVISSPANSHHQHLITAIEAGCHVFCEKPLWWSSSWLDKKLITESDVRAITNQATELVKLCRKKNALLQLNTQWPYTLPSYYELYPQLKSQQAIKSFSMWLSPQSLGSSMIVDTGSHVFSMLYAIVGAGKINNIQSNFHAVSSKQDLLIEFDYLHVQGDTRVAVTLTSSDTFPKPAAYAINELRVDRHVELPNYLISLRSIDNQLAIEDPLVCSIKNFISTIHSNVSLDEVALIDGMTHLTQIYQAVTQK